MGLLVGLLAGISALLVIIMHIYKEYTFIIEEVLVFPKTGREAAGTFGGIVHHDTIFAFCPFAAILHVRYD